MNGPRYVRGVRAAVVFAWAGAIVFCSSPPQAKHHKVDMRDIVFTPRDLDVVPGDTVSWINHDIVPHTVTATDARWDSGEIPPGGAFTLVATGSDTLRYGCRYHRSMTGTLLLRQ